MRYAAVPFACVALLSACNQSPQVDEKDASVQEIADKVRESGADQSMMRPGLWQSKVTIEQFEIPGMPPEMSDRMKTMMAEKQAHGSQTCLTQEDVQRPKEDFFAGKNDSCRYDHFKMGNGKIDAAMRCGEKDGPNQVMQMAGTYSPERYQMQMSADVGAGGGQQGMKMRMRVESNRIGDCTGKEATG